MPARLRPPVRLALVVVLACAAVAAQDPPAGAPAWFLDKAEEAGLTVKIIFGGEQTKDYIIETTGTGVGILDYDNDGFQDVLVVNGTTLEGFPPGRAPTNRLYRNRGDGKFEDVTAKAGLASSGWGQGVCVGDYDNDGRPDVYVTYYGKNLLYHNQGDGTFRELGERAGVAGSELDWGTGCAFLDYDRDGHLDLAVANYLEFDPKTVPAPGEAANCHWKGIAVMCGPRGLKPAINHLYRNRGDGTFEDVTRKAGFDKTSGYYAFSVSTFDYDNDGWTDIYVACDSTPSILYRNQGDGTFEDVAVLAGAAYNEDGREQAGMGSTIGDYNRDGHLDIFRTNFSDDTSTLYRNNGDGTFQDVTFPAGMGLNTRYLGWGTMFFDFDNDGWPDLLLVNGHVYPEVDIHKLGSTYREPKVLYHNQGDGTFRDISAKAGPAITVPTSARGLAIADFWNDGRLSAVVSNMYDRPNLLVNQVRYPHHWIKFRTIGTKSNRDGIGARLSMKVGERIFVDEVRSGSSYNSSSDLRVHFGLGKAAKIDHLEVRWPSGLVERFEGLEVDKIHTIREGSGTQVKVEAGTKTR